MTMYFHFTDVTCSLKALLKDDITDSTLHLGVEEVRPEEVPPAGGTLVCQRFAGWTGSSSSDQPTGSTMIISPEFITAQWSTDNTLLFAAVGGALAGAAVVGLFVFRLRKKLTPS
ncbi:MAG: hypothetical protein JRN21_02015 [Nitrososphaerota archaeon]|nr:hypothetical protein [Nitrososphaerota archaeon]